MTVVQGSIPEVWKVKRGAFRSVFMTSVSRPAEPVIEVGARPLPLSGTARCKEQTMTDSVFLYSDFDRPLLPNGWQPESPQARRLLRR